MNLTKVNIGDVEFEIDVYGKRLFKMRNNGDRVSVYIPNIFPTGEEITRLGENFCDGEYSEIIISDEIAEVERGAFRMAKADKVVWSSKCEIIPLFCFSYSQVLQVTNVENVQKIGEQAFTYSKITSFKWPKACDTIPTGCFCGSKLKSISGIDSVKIVQGGAFRSSCIDEFAWPCGCETIPVNCFCFCKKLKKFDIPDTVKSVDAYAFESSGVEDVRWSSSCPEVAYSCFSGSSIKNLSNTERISSIETFAFANTDLVLNLSEAIVSDIHNGAFDGVNKSNITLPYYLQIDNIDSLFNYSHSS